jgi:cell division septum initiation protein DivIVA
MRIWPNSAEISDGWIRGVKMSEKNFLSWVGYKGEEEQAAPSANAVERIRQLEAQIAELRSRRDITGLTKEEFEVLATETAMSMIKTAQSRESKALATAKKAMEESTASAKALLEGAESKAKSILSGAESRGRKYLEAAESEVQELRAEAERNVTSLVESKKREAGALLSSAKREAERIITDATSEIAHYRTWLGTAITEADRLYRIQVQSLSAAEQAIGQSRARLQGAFEKLTGLQNAIENNLTADNRPRARAFDRDLSAANSANGDDELDVPEVPAAVKRSAPRKPARSVKTVKSVKKSVKSRPTTKRK